MRAKVPQSVRARLALMQRPDPPPDLNELRLKVEASALRRADLRAMDGDGPRPAFPPDQANEAPDDLRHGRLSGAAVRRHRATPMP